MKEIIQIDVMPSIEDYGMRFAYLPRAMSDGYMRETTGIIVEQRTEFLGESIFPYLNLLLRACERKAGQCDYKHMVCLVLPETYERLMEYFGNDSQVHAAKDVVWQFVPEVYRPGYVTYVIHPPGSHNDGCTVWPLRQTQMKLKFA